MTGKKIIFIGIGFLICFNVVAWSAVFDFLTAPPLKVVFFDVGQGDAAFIEIGGLYQILIDGGSGRGVLEKLSDEMGFWDKNIDLIILTHPEKDHLEGLIFVLEQCKVDDIVWTGVKRETAVFEAWQDALTQEERQGAEIKIAQAGQKIIFSLRPLGKISPFLIFGVQAPRETSGVESAETPEVEELALPEFSLAIIEILHPFEDLEGTEPKDSNKTSIVAKLDFGETDFLFTGDIYDSQEKEMIEQGIDLKAEVLKLAHHGSKTSSSSEFLQAVLPQIAVVSCGKNNSYGHPHQQVLERLKGDGIQVLRTDEKGDITIESDGRSLIIK